MTSEKPIRLYNALVDVYPKRRGFDRIALNEFCGAYNLKRQFAQRAGQEILRNYAEVVRSRHIQKKAFDEMNQADLADPACQLAYWIDSLLHNCRGSLETLAHIVNYVYDLGLKEREVSFARTLKKSEEKAKGIHGILKDIRDDAWFTIVSSLRNRSYHTVLNIFVPKVGLGATPLRYTISFPVNPLKGNLTHRNVSDMLLHAKAASMELAEFSGFISLRLHEYLSQVDEIIIQDCNDISKCQQPRSIAALPRLTISFMNLHSWRNLIDIKDIPFASIDEDGDEE